jgi:hypothetical protein
MMHAQMFLKNQTAPMNALKPFAGLRSATVVSSQIGQCLFALENSSRSDPCRLRSIGGRIRPVSALR